MAKDFIPDIIIDMKKELREVRQKLVIQETRINIISSVKEQRGTARRIIINGETNYISASGQAYLSYARIYNNDSSTVPKLLIQNDNALGDAAMQWQNTSSEELIWSAGIDATDGHFKINQGATLGATTHFVMNAAGWIGLYTTPTTLFHIYENSASTTPQVLIENDGAGDAAIRLLLTGGVTWSLGIDNSNTDNFKISSAASLGDNQFIIKNSNGYIGINTVTDPQVQFHVRRSGLTNTGLMYVTMALETRMAAAYNMADGFGPSLDFAISDDGGFFQRVGRMGAVRDGLDNSGKFVINPSAAGVITTTAMYFNSNFDCGLPNDDKYLKWGIGDDIGIRYSDSGGAQMNMEFNSRLVGGDVTSDFLFLGGDVGIGLAGGANPGHRLEVLKENAITDNWTSVLSITHSTDGEPANNIGVALEFQVEATAGVRRAGIIRGIMTDVATPKGNLVLGSRGTIDLLTLTHEGLVGINAIPTILLSVNEKTGLDVFGGHLIKLINKTGGNTVRGQLVEASAGTERAFETASANSFHVIGVIADADIADGSEAWILIGGSGYVLIDAGGCVLQDRLISGGVGVATVSNNPSAADHFKEIGHTQRVQVGAGLALVTIHLL